MSENKAEKSLRWLVNQIPDFEPKTNEEKMLLNIKFYCNAGANEISRLTAENERLRAENANAELKKYEWALNNACAMLYAQGVESPFSDEDWHLQQAKRKLREERKDID